MLNDPILNAMLDKARPERINYMFGTLVDQMAICAFRAEADRSGSPDRFLEDLMRVWREAAIAATEDHGRRLGLTSDAVETMKATVQEDGVEVCSTMRQAFRNME